MIQNVGSMKCPRAMRDDWITDKITNKIGEKIPHNSKPEHVLLRYKRDSVRPPTKNSWWGNAGHKLALRTRKSCSDIQKTEFEIIYERADFRNKKFTVNLRQFFFENNLQNTYFESFKLLLVTTIRMTTAEAERCFSTLKRIKIF